LFGDPETAWKVSQSTITVRLAQKWFLKWPALEQTLLKEQEYPAMR
jgi:hypothetical protein